MTYKKMLRQLALKENVSVKEIESEIGEGGGSNAVYLTQDEYDALPDSKYTDDVEYRITDAGINEITASNVGYDNSVSGLDATTTQKAIDKLKDALGDLIKTNVAKVWLKMSGSGNAYFTISNFDIDLSKYRFLCGYATTGYDHVDIIYTSGIFPVDNGVCIAYQWINGRGIDLETTFYLYFIKIA